jgi:DNA invertase Pin-like site-specific DNA recombinase
MQRQFKPKNDPNPQLESALPLDRPVAVYYRQSTRPQVGNISTDIQTIDMKVEMVRRGWNEADVLLIDADAAVSGSLKIDEREGMRQIFEMITEGKIGAVACQDEDRLFRDVTQIQVNIFIEACREHQVQVITPSITYVFHHPAMGDFYRKQFRYK